MCYYEIEFEDGYAICIKAIRKPSKREAKDFLESDMKRINLKFVVAVDPISHLEACAFYDMSKEASFPIFGQ